MLADLDRERLSAMCAGFGLKSSGAKAELIGRLVEFYDDLTFEERVTKDPREAWYNDYELLAGVNDGLLEPIHPHEGAHRRAMLPGDPA